MSAEAIFLARAAYADGNVEVFRGNNVESTATTTTENGVSVFRGNGSSNSMTTSVKDGAVIIHYNNVPNSEESNVLTVGDQWEFTINNGNEVIVRKLK